MQCPPEIAVIVCEILRTGLLRIRISQDVESCQVEADHLHNLPSLLVDFRPELLNYYWRVERPSYISRCGTATATDFEPMWKSLGSYVLPIPNRALAG